MEKIRMNNKADSFENIKTKRNIYGKDKSKGNQDSFIKTLRKNKANYRKNRLEELEEEEQELYDYDEE